MAVVPLALNIFNGNKIWLSKFDGLNWTTQSKVADNTIDPNLTTVHWLAGAISPNQSTHLGIVVGDSSSPSGLTFLGNGPPDTPHQINLSGDGVAYTYPQSGYTHAYGAFRDSNGIYWLFVRKQSWANPPTNTLVKITLACLRSADGGITWAEQDSANAPLMLNQTFPSPSEGTTQSVYWDGASPKFWVFLSVCVSGGVFSNTYGQGFTFDTTLNGGLGGWTAVTDQFLAVGNSGFWGGDRAGWMFPLSNGNLLAIYSTATQQGFPSFLSYSNGIYTRLAVGGVWQAPSLVRSAVDFVNSAVFDPATDTVYVFNAAGAGSDPNPALNEYNTQGSPPAIFNGSMRVFTVNSGGVASSDLFTFPTPVGNASASGYTDGMDNGIILNGSMWVLYDDWNDNSNAVWAWDMSVPLNVGPGFVKLNLLPHPPEEPPSGPGFDNPPSCGMLFFADFGAVDFTHSFALGESQEIPNVNFTMKFSLLTPSGGQPPGPPPQPGPPPRHCTPSEE